MSAEPFYDYDAVEDEMVEDLAKEMSDQLGKREVFLKDPSKTTLANYLRTMHAVQETTGAIMHSIFRVPAIVHVAGPRKDENHPDMPEREATMQRCKRCGTILNIWQEGMFTMTDSGPEVLECEDISWWPDGEVVGKHDTGSEYSISMYEVGDRELGKHEEECADLSGLEGSFDDPFPEGA